MIVNFQKFNFFTLLFDPHICLIDLIQEKQQLASFDKSCDISEELELKRYGAWSEEARLLGLPAYRASFVFLTRIPLDVVHTFLLMRLITRPEKPSLMSIRQVRSRPDFFFSLNLRIP